jgi:hypothetical protein
VELRTLENIYIEFGVNGRIKLIKYDSEMGRGRSRFLGMRLKTV